MNVWDLGRGGMIWGELFSGSPPSKQDGFFFKDVTGKITMTLIRNINSIRNLDHRLRGNINTSGEKLI